MTVWATVRATYAVVLDVVNIVSGGDGAWRGHEKKEATEGYRKEHIKREKRMDTIRTRRSYIYLAYTLDTPGVSWSFRITVPRAVRAQAPTSCVLPAGR